MNATRKFLTLKVFGFVAAGVLAQLMIPDAAAVPATAARLGLSTASALQPAPSAMPAMSRRCDALDSFGNPVRPCRS